MLRPGDSQDSSLLPNLLVPTSNGLTWRWCSCKSGGKSLVSMSAIFGLFNLDNRPVAADDLDRMGAALLAHGGEGGGIWSQAHVGLGQRLTCFTPEDTLERQPLVSADGERVLVSDGRIDNRDELAEDLGIVRRMSDLPDSVFIMGAYARWGSDCVRHLVGAFTFALWDVRERRLIVVRSAVASPCLFYHTSPRTLAFATMPKGLFALPSIPRDLDDQFLADYLAMERTEPGAGFYRNVSRLLPGQMLVVQPGGWTVEQHWQPDLTRELHYAHDQDYVDAFNELFARVIGDHLRSRSPVGVMMSGGFDSTSIAAVAAQALGGDGIRLPAFTEVPRAGFDGAIVEGRYADETPYVRAMARRYPNLDLNLIPTDGQIYLDGIERCFAAVEAPFRNASNRLWYEAILRAAQQRGVRVLLDGGQGNLTMSWGGDGLLAQLVRAGSWGRAWRESCALASKGKARSPARALLGGGILPLLPDSLYAALHQLRDPDGTGWRTGSMSYAGSPINPDFAVAQRVAERARAKRGKYRLRPSADTRSTRLRVILGSTGRADGFDAGYQALFGVTSRAPASDVRLVEFCLAIPEEQYQRDGETRWLLRRAMAERLPPEVLKNRKRGLQAADWFERLRGAREQILDELTQIEQSDLARQALDLPRLRRLVEQMPHTIAEPGQVMADYRGVLELGLMTGCFIRWVETGSS
jgi:asparagine synthase (glutamine-hydrolysing)